MLGSLRWILPPKYLSPTHNPSPPSYCFLTFPFSSRRNFFPGFWVLSLVEKTKGLRNEIVRMENTSEGGEKKASASNLLHSSPLFCLENFLIGSPLPPSSRLPAFDLAFFHTLFSLLLGGLFWKFYDSK